MLTGNQLTPVVATIICFISGTVLASATNSNTMHQTQILLYVSLGLVSVGSLFYFGHRFWKQQNTPSQKKSNAQKPPQTVLVLKGKTILTKGSNDTYILSLTFQTKDSRVLNVQPGQHFYFHFKKGDKTVKRPYSPTEQVINTSMVNFAVKVYPSGFGSQKLMNAQPGEEFSCTGPSKLHFDLSQLDISQTRLIFLAAGSGLTPFAGMLHDLHQRSKQGLNPVLVFANRAWEDVFFTERMHSWNKSGNIDVIHALSREEAIDLNKSKKQHSEEWTDVIQGRVQKEVLQRLHRQYVENADDVKFLICGTPSFASGLRKSLKEMGYGREHVKVF